MTNKQTKFIKFILCLSILAVSIKMIYTYLTTATIEPYGLFAISIFIASLLELHTFGKLTYLGGTRERDESNELEEHIVNVSSKISYFSLMVIVLIILVVSELFDQKDDGIDLPMVLVFCSTIVTLPFVQFFMAKKYMK